MTSKKLRRLLRIRRVLTAVAAVLFCVAVVSGIMHFFVDRPPISQLEPTEQTDSPTMPTELTEQTDADTVPTEQTEPTQQDIDAEGPIWVEGEERGYTPAGTAQPDLPPAYADNGSTGGADGSEDDVGADAAFGNENEDKADIMPDSGAAEQHKEAAADAAAAPESANAETPSSVEYFSPDGEYFPREDHAPGMDKPAVPIPELPEERTPFVIPAEAETLPQTEPGATETGTAAPETEPAETPETAEETSDGGFFWGLIFWSSLALLIADLAAIISLSIRIGDLSNMEQARPIAVIPESGRSQLTVGTVHRPGKRKYQQDSLGHSIVLDGRGLLAVVADGMGGLKDGDKVSQQIVLRTLELGAKLQAAQVNGALYRILKQVNEDVNRSLKSDGLYKSGSTMIAVLVSGKTFQWISVGDSRIYLYRAGYVNRLNRDHDLLQEWMPEILEGQRSCEAALKDPSARKLTSFIGMGQLKYVDGSLRAIDILPGDRIILMTDGVYGELPEAQMAAFLKQYPDVRQAAAEMDRRIRDVQDPHQDNYTTMILGF